MQCTAITRTIGDKVEIEMLQLVINLDFLYRGRKRKVRKQIRRKILPSPRPDQVEHRVGTPENSNFEKMVGEAMYSSLSRWPYVPTDQ